MCNCKSEGVETKPIFEMPMIYLEAYDRIFSLIGIIERSKVIILQIPMSEMPEKISAMSDVLLIKKSPFFDTSKQPILEHQRAVSYGKTFSLLYDNDSEEWYWEPLTPPEGDVFCDVQEFLNDANTTVEKYNLPLYRFLCLQSRPQSKHLIQFVED